MDDYSLPVLAELEAEAIHILREVAAEAQRPVMMYSVGKERRRPGGDRGLHLAVPRRPRDRAPLAVCEQRDPKGLSERTLLQDAALRAQQATGGAQAPSRPLVICNEAHRFLVEDLKLANRWGALR